MLSPRWRKVLRDVWLHKSRTLLVVLAIVVGIAGSGAVLDTWWLLRQVTRDEFRASNPASATLKTDAVDEALLARVRALPGVRQAQARRTVIGSALVDGGWRTAMLFAHDDFTHLAIGVVKPDAGDWPPPPRAVVVEKSSQELARAAVGSTLTVQVPGGEARALPVAGIARDVGLAPGWMEHIVYGFVTRETLEQLGAPSTLDELQITVNGDALDRDAVRRIAFDVKAAVEAAGHPVRDVDVPVPGRHVHAGQMNSLLMTQGAFGVLALLLSGLLVVNLVNAMLAGQVREIGVMKAIGARAPQLAGMYLCTAALLGLCASLLGIPAAALIGIAYAKFTAGLLNFDLSCARLTASILAPQLLVGALLPVAAAAYPVARGSRISVGEALRDLGLGSRAAFGGGGPTRASGPLAAFAAVRLSMSSGLARPLLLSLRNAFRRRQRMALTLATLAMGGAVYIGALNLRAAITGSVDLLFGAFRYDLGLRMARPYPAAALEAAAAGVPGVARAEAWSGARAAVRREDGTLGNAFAITAPPAGSPFLQLPLEEGRWLRPDDGLALVVNRRLVEDDARLALGARVSLLVAGRPTDWTVVGVVDSGPWPNAYAGREAVAGILGGGASALMVDASPEGAASRLDVLQRVREALNARGLEVQSGSLAAQQRKVVEDHLLMVASFLGVMGQLMILVGGLGLASTMSLAVLERTREIGVLRAIGARHRAILALIQVEGLVIALASWAIALPLSVPMSVVLGKAFGRVMLRVPVVLVPDAKGALSWLAVAVVVSLVACAWPAWRATRITTAAALAYE